MWLLSLPFALVKDLGLMTGPTLFLISWMLFGVYEIGYSIEDPFQGTLRLSILCDAIRRDVLGDEIIRNTAFNLKNIEKTTTKIRGESPIGYEEDDDDDELGADEDMSIEIEDIIIDEVGDVVNVTEYEVDSIMDSSNDVGFIRSPQSNGAMVQTKEKEKEPSVSP